MGGGWEEECSDLPDLGGSGADGVGALERNQRDEVGGVQRRIKKPVTDGRRRGCTLPVTDRRWRGRTLPVTDGVEAWVHAAGQRLAVAWGHAAVADGGAGQGR